MRASNGGMAVESGSIRPSIEYCLPGVRCQSCNGQDTNRHPTHRLQALALRLAGECERGEVFAILSKQGIGFSNVHLRPSDHKTGVRCRFRAAMKKDRIPIAKIEPVRYSDTAALRVMNDLDGYATGNEEQTAHDTVVPDT